MTDETIPPTLFQWKHKNIHVVNKPNKWHAFWLNEHELCLGQLYETQPSPHYRVKEWFGVAYCRLKLSDQYWIVQCGSYPSK